MLEPDLNTLVEDLPAKEAEARPGGLRGQEAERSDLDSGFLEFRRLWSLTMQDGQLFFSGIGFLLVGSLFKALTPIALSRAVVELPRAKLGTAGVGALLSGALGQRILVVLMLGLGTAFFTGLRALCMGTVTARLLLRLRMLVYSNVLGKDLGWHDDREVGELASRVNADCAAVSESLTVHFNVFLRSSVATVFGAVYLFRSSGILAASLIFVWVGLAVLTKVYGRFTRRIAVAKQDRTADLNQAVSEDFGLIRVVRAFGLEDRQRQRFEDDSRGILDLDLARFRAYAGFVAGSTGIASLMSAITLTAGVHLLTRGAMTAEQLIACLMYVREVVDSSFEAIDQLTSLQQTSGKAKRIFEMVDWREEGLPAEADRRLAAAPVADSTIPAASLQGRIEFRNASFRYPSRANLIFDRLSLDIAAGKTTALVGSSGSGKSTVLALVQGLYDVESEPGSLVLDGVPMHELDRVWLRQQMAVVTQEPRLFADTVFNNIAIGAIGAHGLEKQLSQMELEMAVHAAARAANAHSFIMDLPQGYETKVGDMKLLSGGQRQRVAIARALMRKPKILILDEATSALDSQSEATVQAAIDNVLLQGMTCIMVAHRLSTVRNADQIVVMDRGHVVETGTFNELMRRKGRFSQLAAEQQIGSHPRRSR